MRDLSLSNLEKKRDTWKRKLQTTFVSIPVLSDEVFAVS